MSDAVDIAEYFKRVGYVGRPTAAIDTLRTLHRLHPATIPFENLDPLLGRPVVLGAKALEQKLVHDRRGGYCFEHNLLFSHVLRELGFQVSGFAARVLWNSPEGVVAPRGHMLLRVRAQSVEHIVDVGFGGLTLTAPLKLETGIAQETPHEPFRLEKQGSEYRLDAKIDGAWKPIYRFDLQEQVQADYEVASYYQATHPKSIFRAFLLGALAPEKRRLALFDGKMVVHHLDDRNDRTTLATGDELRKALTDEFGIGLPKEPDLDPLLDKLASRKTGPR
jgi:N-hydroxyarylamine O-acetyltransferase